MKKGIVMEQHRNYSIIMTKNGSFEKAIVTDEKAIVGSEVSYQPLKAKKVAILFSGKKIPIPVKIASMACIILLLALPIYFFSGKNETYAYVTVDINPSIEMDVNKDFKVQMIHPLNEDAKKIVKNLTDYKNEKIESVIDMILNQSEQTGMINEDKNMIVGISYTDQQESEDVYVSSYLDSYFSNISGWKIATVVIPENVREKAKDKETSMNEVMASEIMEDETVEDSIDSDDKAIINSFYKSKTEEIDETSSESNDEQLMIKPVDTQTNVTKESKVGTNKTEKKTDNKKESKKAKAAVPSKQQKESVRPNNTSQKNSEIKAQKNLTENNGKPKDDSKPKENSNNRNKKGPSEQRAKDSKGKFDQEKINKHNNGNKDKHHNNHSKGKGNWKGQNKHKDSNGPKGKANHGKGDHGNRHN
ncbi:anti-sigma factor domain-containing protein [Oceanobacillus massiliensis]|uniref:anti-sigma-I factor RsgI family protein n=1 Tax=Oceanobacillus massiliensis TaxID=1465765 RepID=UPI000287C2BA|nr:hypothetical protein [Oceanobacillus massiliensis]